MADDLEIIAELERELGKELPRAELDGMLPYDTAYGEKGAGVGMGPLAVVSVGHLIGGVRAVLA